MADSSLQQPELVGRKEELEKLSQALEEAVGGRGSTTFVCGEAGIGKTRLVSETISKAEKGGAMILRGWCLPDCLEPLMPVKEALRGAGLLGLMEEHPQPRMLSAYLLNDAGMLYARAERIKSDMDADIFAAMLKAVTSFATDSLRMMGRDSNSGGISTIGHSGYNILVQTRSGMSLAVVIEGAENEFLIEDMGRLLSDAVPRLDPTRFDSIKYSWLEDAMTRFVNSPRYDGKFVQDDPKLKLENLFDNILLGVQRLAQRSPVLLFLDDVQWSDPTTLGLFHYLSRNTRSSRVMLLATYRPEDIVRSTGGEAHHLETVMQNMSRESLFTELKLARLDCTDTGMMVERALGACDFPEDFAGRIHKESEGNPFFTLELVRLMVAEQAIVPADGTWRQSGDISKMNIPSKVYDVIRRRLNRLNEEEQDVLECASVVGEKFGSEVLGLSLGLNRMSLLKKLGRIEKEHRLIHSLQNAYSFDHSKIRDVLYDGIGDELRREYHCAIAKGYLELFSGREADIAEELAHHKFMAGDKDAAHYLEMAGDRAKDRYANEEAIRCYSLALGLTLEGVKRAPLLDKLGDLYTITGHCGRAIERFNEALDLAEDPEYRADIWRRISLAHERQSEYELGIAAAEKGLGLLGPEPAPVRSGLLAALTWNHIKVGNYDAAMEQQRTSLANAAALADGKEISIAHHQMGIICWFRGDYEEALGHYQQALDMQKEINDERARMNTLNNIGVLYMETGRLDDALAYFEEGLAYEEKVGDKDGMAGTLDNMGNLYHTLGDLGRALGYHLRGLELYRMAGDRNGVAWSLSSLGYVYPDMGEERKGIACFLESIEICREIGDQHILVYNYYGLADTYGKIGEFTEALRYIDIALKSARELGARREEGASMYVLGCIRRNMGDLDIARESFELAREILVSVGDTTMLTMIDFDYGLLLAKEGKTDDARKMMSQAHDKFRDMKMGVWLKKAEMALAELKAPL
jgi:tetratricopeptide (TPR) repeat protein